MTIGAHLGAGVISAHVLQSLFHRPITPATVVMAAGLAMLPDLDALWSRARQRRQNVRGRINHHKLFSHTPLLYLIAAAVLAQWLPWQTVLLFAAITIGHLALDSWATDDGIMWLYPFCRTQYALMPRPIHADGLHGKAFYQQYYQTVHFLLAESALVGGGLILTGVTWVPRLLHWA